MALSLPLKLAALAAQEVRPDAWDAHLLALLVGWEAGAPRTDARPRRDTDDSAVTALIDRPPEPRGRRPGRPASSRSQTAATGPGWTVSVLR